MSQNTNVRAIETGQKSSIWQAILTCFEANANKMNCELMLTYDSPHICSMCIKTNQIGRNLMGPKTLTTIWGTYMKLVTKYQIPVINSC